MIRLLLVDDHPVVRAGLRAVLAPVDGIEVVAEAGTAADALAAAQRETIDVVLMDLRLGSGGDGVHATESIRALPNPPRVLILTTYETDADILRAVRAGATGYLLKDADPDDLVRAIGSAAAGETVLAPPVAARLLGRMQSPDTALTQRELEIVGRLADGDSNRDIARTLTISEATVKSHLVHIFDKLGVDSRTRVVAEARRRGLL
ncbi:response regulator [Gordonia hankookensis]|uniref:Response regulator transcription factor n=1 Tax=Gordonia hankookensis TaxID=589403 RepID=A0ABR7WD87_9ACTN|nr:response regulator transcription factor [Gordonia hankookensis]MBD1319817.1 response regulator transcription factor [Gordonia hankookensis]